MITTYTTVNQEGKKFAVRVLSEAPQAAHEEAKRRLAWTAANSHKRSTGNAYKPLD